MDGKFFTICWLLFKFSEKKSKTSSSKTSWSKTRSFWVERRYLGKSNSYSIRVVLLNEKIFDTTGFFFDFVCPVATLFGGGRQLWNFSNRLNQVYWTIIHQKKRRANPIVGLVKNFFTFVFVLGEKSKSKLFLFIDFNFCSVQQGKHVLVLLQHKLQQEQIDRLL